MARRVRRLLIVAILLGVGAWVAAVGVTLAAAAGDARDGLRSIEEVRGLDPDSLGDLIEPLGEAREAFTAAADRTGSALLAPARVLPWIGRQIRSADALVRAAAGAAEAGVEAATAADAIVRRPLGTGADRLATMRELGAIAGDARDELAALDLGPEDGLLGLIAGRRAELAGEIDELRDTLDTAARALEMFTDVLGGPRRLLVLGANNAEMRAGAGMFLTVGTLRAAGGALTLGPARSVTDAQPPPETAEPTGDLRDRWGWLSPGDDWRNLMLSPRFDASAELGLAMWRAAGRDERVDAVIALDPAALRALLAATGPVRSGGRMIDADNVLDELLRRQYLRFADRPNELRRAALGTIAEDVFDALNSRSVDPVVLFDALADAARGRHVMAWSSRPAEQEVFRRVGVDGGLGEDSMMLSILNRGGNKLDPFLDVRAALTITPDARGPRGLLEIRVRNDSPEGLPPYVAGPRESHGAAEGEYLGFVAITLPGFAGEGRIDGVRRPLALGADGLTRVVATDLRVPRGAQRTVRVRFRLAEEHGSLVVEPGARVPATRWRYRTTTWRDEDPQVLDW